MAETTAPLRLPPHSMEAEQSVLGALLIDNRTADHASQAVAPAEFYGADHAAIYRTILALVHAGRPADVVTVYQALQASGAAETAGGLSYLNELAGCVPSGRNVHAHARIVAQCAARRRIIRLAADLGAAAQIGGATDEQLQGVIDQAAQELADIGHGRQDMVPRLIADLMPDWLDDLAARAEGKNDALALGLVDVDKALAGGARRGELIVIGARPSMGKSAFTLGVMRAVAREAPVLACTMEDSAHMLIARQVASTGRLALEHVRVPQHAPDSLWQAVSEAAETLNGLPIYIDDGAGLALQDVVRKARWVRAKAGGLGLVVVDYLQLMEDDGETRAYELARVVRGLKNMAKRLDCVVLLLSQLSREADKVTGPPRLDHLAESGAIEQAADVIGLLWRECRRSPRPGNEHDAQLEFAKIKNGAATTVRLWFDGRTQRFEDAAIGPDA